MNKLKAYTIIGAFFVLITGILSHFVYEWSGQNFILGFLFPINESTWEHMKLAFFPMLYFSVFMSSKLKDEYPCVTSSMLFGTLLGTLFIPVFFYTYTGIIGTNYMLLDIGTFVLGIILAFVCAYRLTLSCKMNSYTSELVLIVLIFAVFFFLFTYLPPNLAIFLDPTGI